MTPERYQRVKAILNEVLDTPADERERVLSRHCSADGELESELRRLLSNMEAGGVLDSPPLDTDALRAIGGGSASELEPGGVLSGRFRVVRALGRGGMGQVWEAVDEELREPIAIKALRHEIVADARTVDRLKREVLHARRVSSPHVCRVFDFFVHADGPSSIPYLTMELLRGESLAEKLARDGPLPEEAAIRVLRQCAAGLAAAHATGVVHGDFKPGNVMLVRNSDGEAAAIVTDFGIARHAAAGPADPSLSLRCAGTPAYMAPEQAAGGALTPAADVYSFAVVACELLTGRRPADGGLERLPRRWRASIRRALDPDPAHRGSFPDVAPALHRRGGWQAAAAAALLIALLLWRFVSLRPEPQTIAVLPFTQASAPPPDVYLGESLADEIISSLSRLPGLTVVARGSSARFSEPTAGAAQQLGARYLLTGAVRYPPDAVEITARLVEPARNAIVWQQTYRRERAHASAVHADVVRAVTARLGMPVSLAQIGAFGSASPRPDAIELYERGRRLWSTRSAENLRQALAAFTRAAELEPNFALAHAARADTLAIMAEGSYLPSAEAFPQAKEAALQAIILDPQLPEAHAALGLAQSIGEWDLYNAEKSLRRAILAGPSYLYAHQWYAAVLLKLGRHDDAIHEAEVAARLDPLSPAPLAAVGWMNFYSGRYRAALAVAGRLQNQHPQFPYICLLRADSLLGDGAAPQALAALGACNPEVRSSALYLRSLGVAQAFSGDSPAAFGTVNRLLEERRRQPVADSYLAAVYAALNLPNEAFYWLDQGVTHRDPLTALVDASPFFARIHPDPRYRQLLARIGLPYRK